MNENGVAKMSATSLPALVKESQALFQALAESGGELTPEMESALSNIEVNLPAKIDGYKVMIDRAELEEAYWKKKADEFYAVATGMKNVQARLKESLKFAAIQLNQTELVGNDVKFKLSNSKPKLIIDSDKIDKAYTMQVTTTEIDKKRIEEDLKLGVPVTGAHLEETKSIRAYVNKKLE